jgi:hypothetical protein
MLDHASKGLTNHEIAEKLGLKVSTIKHYMPRVFRKMKASNRLLPDPAAKRAHPGSARLGDERRLDGLSGRPRVTRLSYKLLLLLRSAPLQAAAAVSKRARAAPTHRTAERQRWARSVARALSTFEADAGRRNPSAVHSDIQMAACVVGRGQRRSAAGRLTSSLV